MLDTSESHPHMDVRITRVVTHSSFDRASYEYDIALLRMVRAVPFQPNIIPVCLPSPSTGDLAGKTGSVTGWGRRSEYGQISPVLREVHLPILTNKKCMAMYRLSGQNEVRNTAILVSVCRLGKQRERIAVMKCRALKWSERKGTIRLL